MTSLYFDQDRNPQLKDSVVLYVDLLGTRDASQDQEALLRLHKALADARKDVLEEDPGTFKLAAFTDNIVLAAPIGAFAEGELGSTLLQASFFQYEMTRHGYFIRGGLTCNDIFIGDGFVFGPGLLEAIELERDTAVYPRIVLSVRALTMAFKHSLNYGVTHSPQNAAILVSGEQPFVNYLDVLTEPDTDYYGELERHRDAIKHALEESSSRPRVFDKYRWLADYHNYFCSENFPADSDLLIDAGVASTRFGTLAMIYDQLQKEGRV